MLMAKVVKHVFCTQRKNSTNTRAVLCMCTFPIRSEVHASVVLPPDRYTLNPRCGINGNIFAVDEKLAGVSDAVPQKNRAQRVAFGRQFIAVSRIGHGYSLGVMHLYIIVLHLDSVLQGFEDMLYFELL